MLKQPIENRAEIYLSLRYKQTIQELKLLNNLDLVFERILQIRNKISHYGDKESVKTDNMLEILTEIGEKIENLQKSNGEITKLVEINKNLNGKYDDLSAENVKLAATSIENAFNLQKLSENIETLHRENDSLVEKMRFLEINNIKIIDESSKLSGDHENLTKENEILKESALNSVKNTEIYKSDVNKLVKLHHDEIENLRTECSQLLGLTPIASILHDENELDIILSEDINL